MGLDLDARQRAMLQEMGVRVWLPAVDGESAPEGESAAPRRTAQRPEARAPAGAAQPQARQVPPPARAPALAPARPREQVVGPGGRVGHDLDPAHAREQPMASPHAGAPVAPTTPASVAVTTDAASASERAAAIAAMDWQALSQAVSGCRACALCNSRKNTVFGVGQQEGPVDWLIVGEAPGENEDIKGEPFVGAAGELLDNMLKAVGLDRHGGQPQKVFITNVLKCRPPGNRNPQAAEIAQCTPYLARQIELLKPRVILALGRFAVQTLLAPTVPDVEKQPLGRLRGTVYRWRGDFGEAPVVVSYHPAYLLRSLPDKAKAWADLCLALQTLQAASARAG